MLKYCCRILDSRLLFRSIAACCIAMLLLESAPTALAGQGLDRVMVIVNEGVITQSDLDREMSLVEMELRSAGQTIPPRENLARQLLEDLIVDHILLEIAGRLNITVSNQELQYALSSIAEQNRLTLAQLRQTIEQHRVRFTDYLDDLRKQLTVRQLINRQISGNVNVTEIEIDEYLEQHPELSVLTPVEIELAHIFLKVPTDSSEVEVVGRQELAQDIRQRILDGLPFGQAAQRYSDSPEAAQDGVLGWRKEGQLPDIFLRALDGVLVGGISEVFRSPNGLHLLKLLARRGGSETIVAQYQVRHILVRFSNLLAADQLRSRLEHIRERILGGEGFDAVARLQSEDVNTRALGGSLGWVSLRELPGALGQMAQRLVIDEVSPVFQTGAGWHIAQVTAKREVDLGDEVRRGRAEQAIRARKTEESFDQWARSLRDESFVQYRVRPGE